jgi:hypothetical protein
MSNEPSHFDGTIEVYAPRLIEKLRAAGCGPLRVRRNGRVVFGRTSTVRQLTKEYMFRMPARSK